MTLEAAFQYFKMPADQFEKLAILNQMRLNDSLSAGTLIKVVGK
jgi:hypothetical protein